jgi:hypothetical protein
MQLNLPLLYVRPDLAPCKQAVWPQPDATASDKYGQEQCPRSEWGTSPMNRRARDRERARMWAWSSLLDIGDYERGILLMSGYNISVSQIIGERLQAPEL